MSGDLWGRLRDGVVGLLFRLPSPPAQQDRAVPRGGGRRIDGFVAAMRSGDRRGAHRLGESGDPRAVEPLIAVLGTDMTGAAALALARLGDSRAVEPLIAVLADRGRRDRHIVIEALRQLGDERAVDPLVAALEEGPRRVRESAAKALAALGWHPANDRQRAIQAVAEHDWRSAARAGSDAVEPLSELVRDGQSLTEAASALAEIGDPRAVTVLDQSLVSRGWAAAEILPALARLDPDGMPERCLAVLSPTHRRDLRAEDYAVGELRRNRPGWDARTLESLLALLGGGRPMAAAAAERVLQGDPSPEIVDALETYRERLRIHAADLRGTPIDHLIAELVVIGQESGYLRYQGDLTGFEAGHNVRAVEIGEELNRRGGNNLMLRAHEQVTASAGRVPARGLESSWDGIGEWLG